MMISYLVVAFSIFVTCYTRSRNCIDDFDIDIKESQGYNYPIPHSYESEYWSELQTEYKVTRKMSWSRNFYIFGKFVDESAAGGDDTIISAGLYRGDELIYKTIINCESGTWENWILDKKTEQERILLHGKINKTVSCKTGDDFDLILKNDNDRLANWILNAQPLQHEVRKFSKKTNKISEGKRQIRTGILRPKVKVDSKYSTFNATRFEFTATGRAVFDRFAFGQCDAWPKNMEMQCQKVREWIHARSKANMTEETLAQLQSTPDANFTRGLGTFGNNMESFIPTCLTKKYFNWFQGTVHPDRETPMYPGEPANKEKRAYCCCTNMKTGRVFEDDPEKNCISTPTCITLGWTCVRAYDPVVGGEIYEEGKKEH
ncbi:uncharacterized protein LOC134824853 [Bolinopsis microptera]|uniref:uncharacterized protein LOC134824853 n=1 Tax=Bolinopsis microptera TaxID=2820187 RepID=UPI003078C955